MTSSHFALFKIDKDFILKVKHHHLKTFALLKVYYAPRLQNTKKIKKT